MKKADKTLDQLIVERMKGAGTHPPEWQFWVWWIPMAVLTIVVAWFCNKPPVWIGVLWFASTLGCCVTCFRARRASQWRERLRDRVEWTVPHYLEMRAMHMGMWGPDDDLHLLECHESHMPGDCPLCGAK